VFVITDAIVNNAGILRDRSFARISDADWGKYVCHTMSIFINFCIHFVLVAQRI